MCGLRLLRKLYLQCKLYFDFVKVIFRLTAEVIFRLTAEVKVNPQRAKGTHRAARCIAFA